MMNRKKNIPASAVDRARIDTDQGLRSRRCRLRWVSGELSNESCRDAKGIIAAAGFVDVGVGEACAVEAKEEEEKEFRTALGFRDRGEEIEWLRR
jgi:hypothetical protein